MVGALKPGEPFKDCVDCPEMVLVPAGKFMMGSSEGQGRDSERPQHLVTIAEPFAVARFELTLDEWDACAAHGDCDLRIAPAVLDRHDIALPACDTLCCDTPCHRRHSAARGRPHRTDRSIGSVDPAARTSRPPLHAGGARRTGDRVLAQGRTTGHRPLSHG
jgi:formylglycine-generating enzyme required for sulfatase activity